MKEEFYISLIGEAFDGYTENCLGDRTVYIKHVNIRDQRYLHKYYEKYKNKALSKGVETEEDRIKYVLKEGLWEEKDDMKIQTLPFSKTGPATVPRLYISRFAAGCINRTHTHTP